MKFDIDTIDEYLELARNAIIKCNAAPNCKSCDKFDICCDKFLDKDLLNVLLDLANISLSDSEIEEIEEPEIEEPKIDEKERNSTISNYCHGCGLSCAGCIFEEDSLEEGQGLCHMIGNGMRPAWFLKDPNYIGLIKRNEELLNKMYKLVLKEMDKCF